MSDHVPLNKPIYVLSREAVREVDRSSIEDYSIPGIVLMENAARGLAGAALTMVRHDAKVLPHVVIVCGSGNNGGDGYALARHLHNAGLRISLIALKPPREESDAGINAAICRKMNLPIHSFTERESLNAADLIVDAIFGTGLDRVVEGEPRVAIEWINECNRPVLAVDVPSGLDCETGQPLGVAVKAARTVTFVGWKPGFRALDAQRYLGEVEVADIGCPRELIAKHGMALRQTPDEPERTETVRR